MSRIRVVWDSFDCDNYFNYFVSRLETAIWRIQRSLRNLWTKSWQGTMGSMTVGQKRQDHWAWETKQPPGDDRNTRALWAFPLYKPTMGSKQRYKTPTSSWSIIIIARDLICNFLSQGKDAGTTADIGERFWPSQPTPAWADLPGHGLWPHQYSEWHLQVESSFIQSMQCVAWLYIYLGCFFQCS